MAGTGAGAVRSYSDPRTSLGLGSIWVNLRLLREFTASLTPGRKLPLAATHSFFFTSSLDTHIASILLFLEY